MAKPKEGTTLTKLKSNPKPGLLEGILIAKLEAEALSNSKMSITEKPSVTDVMLKEAELTRDAFVNFLTNPLLNWTISKMTAAVELESLATKSELGITTKTNVKTKVDTIVETGIPVTTVAVTGIGSTTGKGKGEGKGEAEDQPGYVSEKLIMAKGGGHGGTMTALGYAYIGLPAEQVAAGLDDNMKNDEGDFTEVKLFYERIPPEIL